MKQDQNANKINDLQTKAQILPSPDILTSVAGLKDDGPKVEIENDTKKTVLIEVKTM